MLPSNRQTPARKISFPLAETKNPLLSPEVLPPAWPKIRFIYLLFPEADKIFHLPPWLHEIVGWSVFLVLLGAFLSLQIYLTRVLNSPWSLHIMMFTVFVEIILLWRWDQYWY